MSAPDAQSYWISRQIPTDQFLLYCFVGPQSTPEALRDLLLDRTRLVADLCVRVREVPGRLDFPYWAPMIPEAALIGLHAGPRSWDGCRAEIAALLTDRLDPTESPWRLHLFTDVSGAPECGAETAVVAILQVVHALADGRRSASIAREVFAPTAPAPADPPPPWRPALAVASALARLPLQLAQMIRRARPAHLAHRQLERDTAAGLVAPKPPGLEKLPTNTAPGECRTIATVTVAASDLRGPSVTVTVGAMTAISAALDRWLADRGVRRTGGLAAEVTVAKRGESVARNHFRNVAVELYPDLDDPACRAAAITESLRRQRARAGHPAGAIEDRALAAIPAPLLRHGIEHFDFSAIPDLVTGHTVVSSVDRGAADLTLGGAVVVFTAGFPALSSFMGLTHGVHGIGDTVTISVTTSPVVMADLDEYTTILRAEIARASAAFRQADDRRCGVRIAGPVEESESSTGPS